MSEGPEHLHEFGHLANVVHLEHEFVPKFVQKPLVHQYIKDGKLHRHKDKRPVGQFELFLDLVMVGVAHQLADLAATTDSALAIARFVLTFWGAWTIWTDYRNYVNVSGMDDLPQRIYTFCVMALLVGYSANSTGLKIEHGSFINSDHTSHVSVRGTMGFLLVAKCIRFILHVSYAIYLPMFFLDQMGHAAVVLVTSAMYLGAMFAPSLYTCAILFGVGGIIDNMQVLVGALVAMNLGRLNSNKVSNEPRQHQRPQKIPNWLKRLFKDAAFAAINIEHSSERYGGIYTIVLGESVIGLLYNVEEFPQAAGLNTFYGRAFMVLVVAFAFNWLYFTADWNVTKVHPVRRHWFTANVFNLIHWPMCGSLILSSAGVSRMVTRKGAEPGGPDHLQRWFWGGGVGVCLFCLTIMDLLPKWDYWTPKRRIVLLLRVFFRLGLVAISVTIPLVDEQTLNNLQFLGIYASSFVFIVATELLGKGLVMLETQKATADGTREVYLARAGHASKPVNGTASIQHTSQTKVRTDRR